jgi:VWFA-related protein
MRRFRHSGAAKLLIIIYLIGIKNVISIDSAELPKSNVTIDKNQEQQNSEIGPESFKIEVNVALVTTDVTVTGTFVPELHMEDFAIYDNGIPQKVSYFSRGQYPLAVAFLIDKSSSVKPYLSILKSAALSLLKPLQPEDQVALISFDWTPVKISDFTADRLAIARGIKIIKSEGSATFIYDAIHVVARYLANKAPDHRRAIILISDNCNMGGQYNAEQARNEMLKASATLYGT